MPEIHLIPVRDGLSREEIGARLSRGWVLVGRQAVDMSGAIATPGMQMAHDKTMDADIWVLPEPMIPASVVANILLQVADGGGDEETLTQVSQELLTASMEDLRQIFEQAEDQEVA